jgi:hypothetical protein
MPETARAISTGIKNPEIYRWPELQERPNDGHFRQTKVASKEREFKTEFSKARPCFLLPLESLFITFR